MRGEPVLFGQRQHKGFRQQIFTGESGIRDGWADKSYVDPCFVQSGNLLRGRHAEQLNMNCRMGLIETPDSLAEFCPIDPVIKSNAYLPGLAAFARPPSEEEAKLAAAAFAQDGATRQTATEDVMWALINSAEFVLEH